MSTAAAADWRAVRSASLLISFMMTRWADLSSAEVIGSVQSYVRVIVGVYCVSLSVSFISLCHTPIGTTKLHIPTYIGSAESSPRSRATY